MKYDEDYYRRNSQDVDRPALGFYFRIWKRYFSRGRVLEFGCGLGFLARRLSSIAQTYVYEANIYAREEIVKNAPKVEVLDSLDSLPDNYLNSIISLHVMEHILDNDLIIIGQEFSRILCPGGRILIVVPDLGGEARKCKNGNWLGYKDPSHINLKSNYEWTLFFERTWCFNVVHAGADGYYDFPYAKKLSYLLTKDSWRFIKTIVQFMSGRLLLPIGDGEACVFILEKADKKIVNNAL